MYFGKVLVHEPERLKESDVSDTDMLLDGGATVHGQRKWRSES